MYTPGFNVSTQLAEALIWLYRPGLSSCREWPEQFTLIGGDSNSGAGRPLSGSTKIGSFAGRLVRGAGENLAFPVACAPPRTKILAASSRDSTVISIVVVSQFELSN